MVQDSKSGGGRSFCFLLTNPDQPWGPLCLLYNEYGGYFLGVKWFSHEVDHSPHLAPRLRMNGAIPLLPSYAFMTLTGTTFPSAFC